ncbi:hypothetical protein GPALN_004158 [Globodera pallida]|nr:hypothetical protein GPALN_004158 [Globodera pallida]
MASVRDSAIKVEREMEKELVERAMEEGGEKAEELEKERLDARGKKGLSQQPLESFPSACLTPLRRGERRLRRFSQRDETFPIAPAAGGDGRPAARASPPTRPVATVARRGVASNRIAPTGTEGDGAAAVVLVRDSSPPLPPKGKKEYQQQQQQPNQTRNAMAV